METGRGRGVGSAGESGGGPMTTSPAVPELVVKESTHGKHTVSIAIEGKTEFCDERRLKEAKSRRQLVEEICEQWPGFDPESLEQRILQQIEGRECHTTRTAGGGGDPGVHAGSALSTPEEVEDARQILRSGDLIDQIERDLGTIGIVGEEDLRLAIYLICTSRLLRKPLHGIVHGDSSSGKSYIVETVASLVPPEMVYSSTHVSPKALYRTPEGLAHKLLVLGERSRRVGPESEDATKALRELQSSGRISALTIVEGEFKRFEVEGPVASVETTTKEQIFDEDANRCLILGTDGSPEQIALVIDAQARERVSSEEQDRVRRRHWAMQRELAAEPRPDVHIPYGERLARAFPKRVPTEMRSHLQLRGAIKASAVLHRFQRQTGAEGQIIAELADYSIALRVVGPSIQRATTGTASPKLVEFWSSVVEVYGSNVCVTAPEIAAALQIPRNRVNERLQALEGQGVVAIEQASRGPTPAKWRILKMELPTGNEFLPTIEELQQAVGSASTPPDQAAQSSPAGIAREPEPANSGAMDEFDGIPI